MLSTSNRLRIQEILKRLARGQQVTLNERVYIHKFADRDQTVSCWLNKAKLLQHQTHSSDPLDNFLNDLGLSSSEPQSAFDPKEDDLGDWFSGAPSWLSRS